jgi:hypothetical protein
MEVMHHRLAEPRRGVRTAIPDVVDNLGRRNPAGLLVDGHRRHQRSSMSRQGVDVGDGW